MRKEQRPLGKTLRKQAKTSFDPRRAQERLVRLKLQYELLDQRISRVEEGIERVGRRPIPEVWRQIHHRCLPVSKCRD